MKFYSCLLSFLSLGLFFFSGALVMADDWRPSGNAYQAKETREECSVMIAVRNRTKSQLDRRLNDLKVITESTQNNFKQMKYCQKKNGILSNEVDDGQTQTAMLCGESYDLWLLDGTHLMTVEEEVGVLKQELKTLIDAERHKCTGITVAKK